MDVLQNPKYSYLLGKQPFFYKVFKTLFYFYSKLVFSTYAPISVVGRENIPDSSFIFCSNHNSHLDVALLSVSTKKNYNQMAMLAAKDYFFDSWLKRISINMVMNLIPVDRKINGVRKFAIKDTLALVRAFTAIPMHALCGIIMGFLISQSIFEKKHNYLNLFLALFIPVGIHGLYNYSFSSSLVSYQIAYFLLLVFSIRAYLIFKNLKLRQKQSIIFNKRYYNISITSFINISANTLIIYSILNYLIHLVY